MRTEARELEETEKNTQRDRQRDRDRLQDMQTDYTRQRQVD